jgi:hypothetical protein
LDDAQRAEAVAAFGRGPFRGPPTRQYGFVKPNHLDGAIWGLFAHQTSEQLTDYRPTGSEPEQVSGATLTYEHYWYIVWLDSLMVLLQQRRLPQTKDLTNLEVARDFEEALTQIFLPVTGQLVAMSPVEEAPNEEGVRELFSTGRIFRLRVSALAGRRVPVETDLTNPRPDANGVLHEYVDHDFARGVGEVTMRADENDPAADISKSFYAKGIVAAGIVEEVSADLDGTTVRLVRESKRSTLNTDDPITAETVLTLRGRVLKQEYEPASDGQQETLFGFPGIVD